MSLSGRSVLVMEDNPVLAADLTLLLEDAGARVIGPFRYLDEGLAQITGGLPDAALLDVELLDGRVLPLAERLRDGGVPFVFYSAKGSSGYEVARQTGAPLLSKSNPSRAAIDLLQEVVGGVAVG